MFPLKNCLRLNRKVSSAGCLLLSVFLQFLIVTCFVEAGPVLSRPGYDICYSEACNISAGEYLRNMNPNVPPCTDFYEFACGNYKNYHQVDPVFGEISYMMEMEKSKNRALDAILSRPIASGDIEALRKAKQFHQSCIDEGALENIGLSELKSTLSERGGWPAVTGSSRSSINVLSWQQIDEVYLTLVGESAFFKFSVEIDKEDKSKYSFVLKPPLFAVPDYMLIYPATYSDELDRYSEFIIDVITKLLEKPTSAERIKKDAENIVAFEVKLSKIKRKRDSHYAEFTRLVPSMFQMLYEEESPRSDRSTINWINMLRKLHGITNVPFTTGRGILVNDQDYFMELGKVLDQTPADVLVNYVHWKFVYHTMSFTNYDMRSLLRNFRAELLLNWPEESRALECLNLNPAYDAAVFQYLQTVDIIKPNEEARKIIAYHKTQVYKQINAASWLDRITKAAMIKKLERMEVFIGHPEWLQNPSAVNEHFRRFTTGTSFFKNYQSTKKFLVEKSLQLLQKSVNKRSEEFIWSSGATMVNALYKPFANALVAPAGVMQAPNFMENVPKILNFAGIGFILAHELSHAFDKNGFQHDFEGSPLVLPERTNQALNNRAQCFINQFNGYQYKELEVFGEIKFANGQETLNENIADTSGMHTAYGTFRLRAKDKFRHYQRLPGLDNFTDKQLFFLAFANIWCEYLTPEKLRFTLTLAESHSSSRHRVNGVLSNMKEFAKAFECPPNSPMNPNQRCNVWT
ncbi:neprilysin-1 [Orussus abietinus]|uniref:neprilysin-1 n=1 Tax=Orussus abietinus TaxID=222816 RepID=UPI0006258B7C|nr:neprilysin-1 [Orussus abietinus]